MKRPFAVFCAILAALSVVWYVAKPPDREDPLREAAALLAEEAESGGKVTLAGKVAKCSAVSSGVRLSVNHLTIQRKDNSEQSLLPDLNVTITTEYADFLPGDEIAASGKVVFWEPDTNPGQFDAQEYYFSQNTVCMLSNPEISRLRTGRMSLARALCLVRRRLGRSFEEILEERQARTMEAICLGERNMLTQEWKEFYQEGGIAHILAISGLHISLIGMCLYQLLRKLGAPFGLCCAVSGTVVVLYVLMAGAGVSAVRALIMFAFWLGAQYWGRKYDMITAAAAAAMLLLLADARNLSQSSFLLSFAAVLTIALLVPCLQKSFREAAEKSVKRAGARGVGKARVRRSKRAGTAGTLARGLTALLLPGFAIWLGTLPVTLYFFYQAVPWSILINLAVVPLMTALMACGLAAAVIGLLFVPAGIFCAAPSYYLLELFELLCRLKEGLPASVWVAGRPAVWRIVLYYGILLAAGIASYRLADRGTKREKARNIKSRRAGMIRRMKRREHGKSRNNGRVPRMAALCILWICCSAICIGLMSAPDPGKLEITCLDVGQGDATLLRLPGGVSCLVDGGSSSESKLWRYRIGQAVKYYGVRTLDYIFLSHADEDHVSGIEEYLQEYEPGFAGENVHGVTLKNLVLPPTADPEDFAELRTLALDKGIQVLRMEAGDWIGSSPAREATDIDWSITCLAPDADALTGDRNEDSMVLLLRYGEFRMLFTGDLEGAAEQRLAASGEELSADVLKVGHHGSKNASSEEFLLRVSPQTAVISCGENNPYGHPAPETVQRLRNSGSRILQTPQSGAVMIESDGETYSVETYHAVLTGAVVGNDYI